MTSDSTRCDWCHGDTLYRTYHDEVWGVPCFDDDQLFEFLLLEGAQAGLAWITVLRKQENYRQAFDDFDAEKIARYDEKKLEALRHNSGIIRNKLKIASAVQNAQAFLAIKEKHNSFSDYLWQFVDGQAKQNHFASMAEIPALTPESERMSKSLKKAGFNFVGPTICYAYMQACGLVNDHITSCYRHNQCAAMAQDQAL